MGNLHHFAQVTMELHLGDRVLPVAQLGPDFLRLRAPCALPPGAAEVRLVIDGHERRLAIRLPDGSSAGQPRTRIEPAGAWRRLV